MAKLIRIVAMVAAAQIADALDALGGIADTVTMETATGGTVAVPSDDDDDDAAEVRRPDVRRVATAGRPTVARTRMAGKVIYTPAGTQRQITRMLEELRGVTSMRALVLRDLAKHPGSSNREVRERIATRAKAAGLSVESVDNVIWQMVNKGQITKRAEAE